MPVDGIGQQQGIAPHPPLAETIWMKLTISNSARHPGKEVPAVVPTAGDRRRNEGMRGRLAIRFLPGTTRLGWSYSAATHATASLRSSGGTCGLVVRPRFRNPNPRSPGHYNPELPEIARCQGYVTHRGQEP